MTPKTAARHLSATANALLAVSLFTFLISFPLGITCLGAGLVLGAAALLLNEPGAPESDAALNAQA